MKNNLETPQDLFALRSEIEAHFADVRLGEGRITDDIRSDIDAARLDIEVRFREALAHISTQHSATQQLLQAATDQLKSVQAAAQAKVSSLLKMLMIALGVAGGAGILFLVLLLAILLRMPA